jgi:hypothetical protein
MRVQLQVQVRCGRDAAGLSICVPYEQCTAKPAGVVEVLRGQAGDTLLAVAETPGPVVLDPIVIRNANLDVLYENNTPHAGMHLRLLLHTCFEDELHDCHIMTADDSTLGA